MNIRALSYSLVAAVLLFPARPVGAQTAAPATGNAQLQVADELLVHMEEGVTVIRDGAKALAEKAPALQNMSERFQEASRILPADSPALAVASIIYAQSQARFSSEVSGQQDAITMAQNQLAIVEKSVSGGDLKVLLPAERLSQVGVKLRDFGHNLGESSDILKALAEKSAAFQKAVNSDVPAAIVKDAASAGTAKALLVARPALPSGTLGRDEVVTGFYLIINNDSKEHTGTLTVEIITGNGLVNGQTRLSYPVTVPGNHHAIESFTFQRTGDGTITARSNFAHDVK